MDGPAAYCANCGHPVGTGRFCTNCGTPVGGVPTAPPEPAYLAPAPEPPTGHRPELRPGPGPGLWIGASALLLVLVLLGGWLLLHGGSGSTSTGGTSPIVPPVHHTSHPTSSTTTSPPPSASQTPAQVGAPVDVAGFARASAPAHAPAGVDFTGAPVTYVAANLVDGTPDTCWRQPGDATGTVITLRLDQPTRLTRVGLINGYAKTAFSGGRPYDWYAGNRRVLSVDWIFDDGSSVSQLFSTTRVMQSQAIDPVTTSTVQLRITSVSPPGKGRAARNDTAISEISLVGRPG
jgi:hypothetical protein